MSLLEMTQLKWFRRLCLFAADVGLCAGAYLLAFQLRFLPAPLPSGEAQAMWRFLPVLLAIRVPVLLGADLYRLSWRYVGIPDLLRVWGAAALGSLLFTAFVLFADAPFSRGVLLLDGILAMLFLSALRLLLRLGATLHGKARRRPEGGRRRVLIVGVNDLAESLARDFDRRADAGYRLVGFLAETPQFRDQTVHGRPVFGTLEELATVVVQHQVQEVILALPGATGTEIRRIIRLCERLPVQLRILQDPWDGHRQVALAQVRDLRLEDLLRRPPVRIDVTEAAGYLSGEVVLVTGAGGSIGAELVRQLVPLRPKRILLFGHGEHSVYQIDQEIRQEYDAECVPLIGDICDRDRLRQVFARYRPTVVFHAAAHKHVPLMEANATEAVKNNILGTRNLLEAAERFGVKTFLFVSTDKAVNPTSVMGASKRVAEMLVQTFGRRASEGNGCRAMVVRFGNVLGSRGSVVPAIQRQILRGLPVTITHPDMERFFMTIPEAVALVIQAGALGRNGEVFVLDMGEPVRILDLARDLVRLCGLVPDRDVMFRFTGIRPGEKLFEEVLTAEEGTSATRCDRIFRVPAPPIDERWLQRRIEALAVAAREGDEAEIRRLFRELIPAYQGAEAPPERSLPETALRDSDPAAEPVGIA